MDDRSDRPPAPNKRTPARPFFKPGATRENDPASRDDRPRTPLRPFRAPSPARPVTPPPLPPIEALAPDPQPAPESPDSPSGAAIDVAPATTVDDPGERTPPTPSSAPTGTPHQNGAQSVDDDFDIVVGESLLEVTGEFEASSWGGITAREKPEVDHPTDWSAKLDEDAPRRTSDGSDLRITSESGLDWESWGFGRNTSEFAQAGDGFVIHRHELPPEAADLGAGGSAPDSHGFELRSSGPTPMPDREEPAPRAAAGEPEKAVSASAPVLVPDEPTGTASSELEPETILASIGEFLEEQEKVRGTAPPRAAEAMTTARLDELKEVEPWALPPEPEGADESMSSSPESVAVALERLADRIRRGELALPPDMPTVRDESALAAALAAMLRTPGA